MRTLALKPTHKRIAAYHTSLADFAKLGVKHETAVRAAFQALLEDCTSLVNKGRADKWKLVPEYSLKTKAGAKITPDGALLDSFRLMHGLWEAKDSADDLDKEITRKFKLGYPRDNILFQSPNLRRELPRLPLVVAGVNDPGHSNAATFHAFAAIGKELADLHVHYEQAAEHPLQRIENPDEPLNWRVEKMRLTKDKTALTYNGFLTLAGIPEAAFAYRLRLPPRQPQRAGMGDRPIPIQHRRAQRHHQRPKPRRRARLHREAHWQSHHREPRNAEADRDSAGPRYINLACYSLCPSQLFTECFSHFFNCCRMGRTIECRRW